MKNTVHYNIMTSCDNNLVKYVAVQLYSISENLKNSTTHYYLLHRNLPDKSLKPLDALCRELGNILFHDIRVPEAEMYDALAKHGGGWAGEAYFSLCSHQILPEHVKKILYVDAGDVFFTGDIAPFYQCDFEGKALLVTPSRYKRTRRGNVPYDEKDLDEPTEGFPMICRGVFNSGSYLINLDKLREAQLTIDDWVAFSRTLCMRSGQRDTSHLYWGDQGLLSAAFIDDLKLYAYPEIKDIWYLPYNFCLGYYNWRREPPSYDPAVVHFAGSPKPWTMSYPIAVDRFIPKGGQSIRTLNLGQAEWYYLWHEYAICTDRILTALGY